MKLLLTNILIFCLFSQSWATAASTIFHHAAVNPNKCNGIAKASLTAEKKCTDEKDPAGNACCFLEFDSAPKITNLDTYVGTAVAAAATGNDAAATPTMFCYPKGGFLTSNGCYGSSCTAGAILFSNPEVFCESTATQWTYGVAADGTIDPGTT